MRSNLNLPKAVTSEQSPRTILAADFTSLNGGLPIRGGWGYTKDDACIIDRDDPLVNSDLPFDRVGIEHTFVEKRTYEEMIIFRAEGDGFSDIKWELIEQQYIQEEGITFDKLVIEITAFHDGDWGELRAEYDGPKGHGMPCLYPAVHQTKREQKMVRFTREFWFDITSDSDRR